jgi:hypothetical protein
LKQANLQRNFWLKKRVLFLVKAFLLENFQVSECPGFFVLNFAVVEIYLKIREHFFDLKNVVAFKIFVEKKLRFNLVFDDKSVVQLKLYFYVLKKHFIFLNERKKLIICHTFG